MEEELPEFQQKRESSSEGKEIEPYVAFIDNFIHDGGVESLSVYVIINKVKFAIDSKNLIEAVDHCYQSFFALKSDFPR